ncbi:MAG: hypothetical protein KJ566_03070 [Nanoarchaeota archaeon]|nr:hypothetical protein [Nanoarchaeota archaeon]
MKNTKGLSGVITTLIIILLVIAAIGIIWAVVNPFIKDSGEEFDTTTKCLNVGVEPTKLSCEDGICNVTVQRSAGEDEITGVKLIFYDTNEENTYINTTSENIVKSAIKTYSFIDTAFTGVSKVEVAAYFTDASGNDASCQVSGTMNA